MGLMGRIFLFGTYEYAPALARKNPSMSTENSKQKVFLKRNLPGNLLGTKNDNTTKDDFFYICNAIYIHIYPLVLSCVFLLKKRN